MERDTAVISRYHYKEGYYVEVVSQIPSIGNRDYWLCNQNEDNKLFIFGDDFKNVRSEERSIAGMILKAIKTYEGISSRKQKDKYSEILSQ